MGSPWCEAQFRVPLVEIAQLLAVGRGLVSQLPKQRKPRDATATNPQQTAKAVPVLISGAEHVIPHRVCFAKRALPVHHMYKNALVLTPAKIGMQGPMFRPRALLYHIPVR